MHAFAVCRPLAPTLKIALRELSGALEARGFYATQSAVIAFGKYHSGSPLTEVFSWLGEHGADPEDPSWIFGGDVGALTALVRDDLRYALTEFCAEDEVEICRRHIVELMPLIRRVERCATKA